MVWVRRLTLAICMSAVAAGCNSPERDRLIYQIRGGLETSQQELSGTVRRGAIVYPEPAVVTSKMETQLVAGSISIQQGTWFLQPTILIGDGLLVLPDVFGSTGSRWANAGPAWGTAISGRMPLNAQQHVWAGCEVSYLSWSTSGRDGTVEAEKRELNLMLVCSNGYMGYYLRWGIREIRGRIEDTDGDVSFDSVHPRHFRIGIESGSPLSTGAILRLEVGDGFLISAGIGLAF
jgi:hypothetical protein